MAKVTIEEIKRMKQENRKIVMMTAYDFQMARIIDRVNVEMILVGDSGGRNLLGHEDTNAVTMDEMVLMTRAVARGAERALVVADMPFMSYQVNDEEAVRNAGRLVQEGGAQAVKPEVDARYASAVEAMIRAGIPVMAHLHKGRDGASRPGTEGYRLRDLSALEEEVWRDVRAMEKAGAFSLLLTGIPAELATRITRESSLPTIAGHGAGDECSGQIGVTHGVVGFNVEELDRPRAAYGPVAVALFDAVKKFTDDVRAGKPVRSRREQ